MNSYTNKLNNLEKMDTLPERNPLEHKELTSWYIYRLLPSPLKDAVEVSTWRRCYTMQEVNSALSKIQLVGYSQKIVSVGMILLINKCFRLILLFLW